MYFADMEQALRRDLRRTKALLQDAQLMLQKNKDGVGSRTTVKQLRNQVSNCPLIHLLNNQVVQNLLICTAYFYIEVHLSFFLLKCCITTKSTFKVNILLYSDPYHWTRSALHCWQLVGKTNVCSVYGAVGSPAYYSLAPKCTKGL